MAFNAANPFSYLMSGGNRTYNAIPNQQYAAFSYAFNPYFVDDSKGTTGQHQLLTTNNQGALRVDIGSGITVSATFTGGNVNVTNTAPIPVSGVVQATVVIPTYSKVSSSGYVSTFAPLTGAFFLNKINGISKSTTQPSFIQVYDGPTGVGNFPVASVSVLQNNSFFIDFAENGVAFSNGITITNSTDGVVIQQAGLSADFFVTCIYR